MKSYKAARKRPPASVGWSAGSSDEKLEQLRGHRVPGTWCLCGPSGVQAAGAVDPSATAPRREPSSVTLLLGAPQPRL